MNFHTYLWSTDDPINFTVLTYSSIYLLTCIGISWEVIVVAELSAIEFCDCIY